MWFVKIVYTKFGVLKKLLKKRNKRTKLKVSDDLCLQDSHIESLRKDIP